MNKFALACIAGATLFCAACTHHPHANPGGQADSLSHPDTAKNDYFPIAEELESEIREVDSTPVAIKRIVIANGRRDSAFIKPAEFNVLAMQFIPAELRDGRFEKEFTETSFMDNATHAATFTYSANNNDLSLQRVDIVATPRGANHQVQSVYLEKTRVSGDSSILEKMYWRSRHRFQVISLIGVKGRPPVQRQVIVSWESGDKDDDNE
ncbi:MAG TPA: hypothetical protein VMH27_15625 [Puia sp.]|nr:hypothetical protein [Puia sp.]